MKYLKQFLIILGISFVGEGLKYALPLPVPASIYGMLIMFIALITGVLKLDCVKETGKFLIEIMPVMFIPAGVGLITSWSVLKSMVVSACVITIVTIITVVAATGRVSQAIIRYDKRKQLKSKVEEGMSEKGRVRTTAKK